MDQAVDELYERLRADPSLPDRRGRWDAVLTARCGGRADLPGKTLYVPLRLFRDWYTGEADVDWTGESPEDVWQWRPIRIGGPHRDLADRGLWTAEPASGVRLAGRPAHCVAVVRAFFRFCTLPATRAGQEAPLMPPGLPDALQDAGARPALWELLFDTLGVLCLDPLLEEPAVPLEEGMERLSIGLWLLRRPGRGAYTPLPPLARHRVTQERVVWSPLPVELLHPDPAVPFRHPAEGTEPAGGLLVDDLRWPDPFTRSLLLGRLWHLPSPVRTPIRTAAPPPVVRPAVPRHAHPLARRLGLRPARPAHRARPVPQRSRPAAGSGRRTVPVPGREPGLVPSPQAPPPTAGVAHG